MTEKTPIEKAAEDILSAIAKGEISLKNNDRAAEIARRRLEKEVPARDENAEVAQHGAAPIGHNQCRRAIGLRDEEGDIESFDYVLDAISHHRDEEETDK